MLYHHRAKQTTASASAAVMSGRARWGSLNGKLGLARVVPTDCQGILKSLPDDVLKVRVHGGMRARSGAKEKPRRVCLPPARPLTGSLAWPRA